MTTYLDESFAKVWVDETIPCIFSSIRHSLTKIELNTLATNELICAKQLHKKNKELYFITDLSQCGGLSQEMASLYMKKILLHKIISKNSYKLFVQPKGKVANTKLINDLSLFPSLKTDVFESFEEALRAVNYLRISYFKKAGHPKTILGYIFSLLG